MPEECRSYHGTFVHGSLHYPMRLGFPQEFEVRHYEKCRHACKQSDDRCFYAVVDFASCYGSCLCACFHR